MSGSDYQPGRVIVMRHRGNIANKLLQYMGAIAIASRIKDCRIVNVSIPEFGIELPDDTVAHKYFDNVDLWSWDPFVPHIESLARTANESQSIRIMMADHLLRMEFLLDRSKYAAIFPPPDPMESFGADEIVINIRAGEILSGVPHYPLVPVAFYQDVVERTGLKPVFIGQLADSAYVRELRATFPEARFVDSRGARADFDLLRSAKNIVVAISTFSWLGAWLSDADTIVLPMSGFFNPAHHREIDLLPVDDVRYRFFLFPLNYGVSEAEALVQHEKMRGQWKEISRNQVALLKSSAPFLRPARENYDGGMPRRTAESARIAFDSVWYAHEYMDAAMEISEGWFDDPLHHYLEVGRLRGYKPTKSVGRGVGINPFLANLALNQPSTQSSLSAWSRGRTTEEDAATAVNGRPWEGEGFHTSLDEPPWWQVDLGAQSEISGVRIFNRDKQPEWVQRRASPLVVEYSADAQRWEHLFETQPGQIFGGYSDGSPLVWSTDVPVVGRFVRISISRKEILHLSQVEVFGRRM